MPEINLDLARDGHRAPLAGLVITADATLGPYGWDAAKIALVAEWKCSTSAISAN